MCAPPRENDAFVKVCMPVSGNLNISLLETEEELLYAHLPIAQDSLV